jgi:hypothetical protein
MQILLDLVTNILLLVLSHLRFHCSKNLTINLYDMIKIVLHYQYVRGNIDY